MTERYGWDQTPTPDLGLDITKAPADIQRLYKWIIEKMYGEDVASAYGQAMVLTGILAKNAEAMSLFTSGKMDALETFVNDTLIELTNKDIISAPEIIASRDGEVTLSDRLARDFGSINYKMSNMVVNVKDFGAIGDNSTDDTLSIQSAIDFAASRGGGTVYFPYGKYICMDTIVVTPSLIDTQGRSIGRINLEGDNSWGSRLEFRNAPNVNGIHVVSTNTTIKNIGVADAKVNGIYCKGSYRSIYNLRLENIYVTGALQSSFRFEDLFFTTVEHCYSYGAGKYGFAFFGSQTSLNIENNYSNIAGEGGFYLENANYSTLSNNASDNTITGYIIKRPRSLSMSSNGCEVSQHAIDLSGIDSSISITNLHTYRIELEEIVVSNVNNSVIKIEGGNSVEPINPSVYNYLKVDDSTSIKLSLLNIIDSPNRVSLVGGLGKSRVLLEGNYAKYQDTQNFTPSIRIGGNNSGVVLETASGNYRKVGRLIFFTLNVTVSSIGGLVGAVTIEGLPEPSSIFGEVVPIVNRHNVPGVVDLHMRFDGSGTTHAKLYHMNSEGLAVALDNTKFTRGRFMVSGYYTATTA